MKKVAKVVASVMLVVAIFAAAIMLTPWVPVGDGLWSPLDLMKSGYREGSIEAFIEPNKENYTGAIHRSDIYTIEQAIEYYDAKYPILWADAYCTDDSVDYYWVESGADKCNRSRDEMMDRLDIVNVITYLLSDDMEIYTVVGFRHKSGEVVEGGTPIMAINCIKTKDGYEFIDPVKGMQGDVGSRYGALLLEAKVSSIEEYVDLLISDPEIYSTLDFLYMFKNGERIEYYVDEQGVSTLRAPMQKAIYQNLNKGSGAVQVDTKAHIKPENIDKYQLSQMLGGTTLTPEEAYDLVYAEPEVIQEKVKTAPDVLMYMLAAQIGDSGGCYCDKWGEYTWHTNFTAKEVMEKKLGNCGSFANLANYLLEGDYEEVGFVSHAYYPGNGGGHVYNYILHEGKYYIVDYSWYMFANYAPSDDFPVQVLDSLEAYDGVLSNNLYGDVCLVFVHTSTGMHLPNVFGEDHGDPTSHYVPEGAEYTVLYQAEDGYQMKEAPFDKSYYDWTVYWPGYVAPQ